MEYNRSDKLLTAAFNVVRKYDPALYARMSADEWRVATDYETAFANDDQMFYPWSYAKAMSAFGTTLSRSDRSGGTPEVFINPRGIIGWSQYNDVPTALFAGDVLAHEYRHIHQPASGDGATNELSAFRAGSAFATKLPAPYGAKIKALSDETLATYSD